MKKNYIKPTACVSMTQTHIFLHVVSPFAVKNAAVDGSYNGPNSTDTKVDNNIYEDPFEQDSKVRTDNGPWESIW